MTQHPSLSGVDLTNCDREPIHQLNTVQSFGFLLAIGPDWMITRASANLESFIGRDAAQSLGQPIDECLSPEAVHALRNRLQSLRGSDSVERAFGLDLMGDGKLYDVALHTTVESVVIEAERTVSDPDLSSGLLLRGMLSRLRSPETYLGFCREAARQVRMLTGFTRIMIYRFAPDGSGEVIAESLQGSTSSMLGLRFPASDIPKQAKALYARTWLRIVADVDSSPVDILPLPRPDEPPLDLSLSVTRSVSPIHIEYLRNMGVVASLSISIIVDGRLWGLIACHSDKPRYLSFERRTTAELFGQIFSLLLEGREREENASQEARARLVQDSLIASIVAQGSTPDTFVNLTGELRNLFKCDGIGISLNGGMILDGLTPTREEFIGVVRFLNGACDGKVFASGRLGRDYLQAADFPERAAGLLAVPLSRSPRDYIVFFRREIIHTVNWAGNPDKPAELGPNGLRLTPRKSFEAWQEVTRGESIPWNAVELRVGESLRVTLMEVVLRMTDMAARERQSSTEKQELLIAELNHRVRNILGLVKGVLAQTSHQGSAQEFAEVVSGRVHALARAHDQITNDDWRPISLKQLVQAESEAYLNHKADRIRIEGQPVTVAPQAFSTMALVIHELMTNSAKYGALCDRSGWIWIRWDFEPDGRFVFNWKEHGGPPVQAPTRRGFGSVIIERSIPYDLKGEAQVKYHLDGLEARFVLPAALIQLAEERVVEEATVPKPVETLNLVGKLVLVVEDNMIIAMDAEDLLRDLGATRIVTAGSVMDSLRQIESETPDIALLDFSLGNETAIAVADRLAEMKVPFAFATGYGETMRLTGSHTGRPIIKKPYNQDSLRSALSAALSDTARAAVQA